MTAESPLETLSEVKVIVGHSLSTASDSPCILPSRMVYKHALKHAACRDILY